MDFKEIFEEIWPWLLAALTVWGAMSDRKKKQRKEREDDELAERIMNRPAAEPSQTSLSAMIQGLARTLQQTPPPAPQTEEKPAADYGFDAAEEGVHAVDADSVAAKATVAAEADSQAAANRSRRRAALRRAVIWSEVLPPKFREI